MECLLIKRKHMLQCSEGGFHDAEYGKRHVEVNAPFVALQACSGATAQQPSRFTSLAGMRTGCQPMMARRGAERAAECSLV
jgi:hypothetical protein